LLAQLLFVIWCDRVRGSNHRQETFLANSFEASQLTGVVDGFVLTPQVYVDLGRQAELSNDFGRADLFTSAWELI
jgi:hypothetical protein